MTPTKIGKRLRKARQNLGLTQTEAAKKAGISVNYYARIERNEVNPSVEVFEKIAKALKAKSSKLLGF